MKRKIVFKKQKDFERNSYWKDTRDSSNQNQKRKNKKEEEWVSQFLRIIKKKCMDTKREIGLMNRLIGSYYQKQFTCIFIQRQQ